MSHEDPTSFLLVPSSIRQAADGLGGFQNEALGFRVVLQDVRHRFKGYPHKSGMVLRGGGGGGGGREAASQSQ